MKNELSRGDEVYGNDVFQILLEYEVSRSVRYPNAAYRPEDLHSRT